MRLSSLLKGLSDIETLNFKDLEITSVSCDSRKCRPGAVFFAIKGARLCGRDFIPDAHMRGARVFVCEEKTNVFDDSVTIYSKNIRKTLAEMCSKMSGNPEKRLMFVGITGTKGKTTTAYITSKILDGIGVSNLMIGTLGIGKLEEEAVNTTPDPTLLFPVLKEACHRGIKVIVLEVSSQALRDFRVHGIVFDCVVFTGLGQDHIGASEHPTFSDYVASKRALFHSYGAKRAVVNFDDPYSSYMSAGIPKVIKCGFTEGAELQIKDFKDGENGSVFKLNGDEIKSLLSGRYNARNIALAIGAVREIWGTTVEESAQHIEGVSVPGRFNVYEMAGKKIVVDYAHNSDSMREVLTLAGRLFGGRIICVFGSVGDRSFSRRGELAGVAEKYADFSVITTDNPGFEFPLGICADIYGAFTDKTLARIVPDRASAIDYALSIADTGDTVMILGKGHERSINICGKSIPFSDTEYVKELCVKARPDVSQQTYLRQ